LREIHLAVEKGSLCVFSWLSHPAAILYQELYHFI